jgi:hypothetical protein
VGSSQERGEPRHRIGGRGRIWSGGTGLEGGGGSESIHNTGWSAAVALEVKGEGAAQRRRGQQASRARGRRAGDRRR